MTSRIDRLIATMYDNEELWNNSTFYVWDDIRNRATGDVCFMAALAYPEHLTCNSVGLRRTDSTETLLSMTVFSEFFEITEEKAAMIIYGYGNGDQIRGYEDQEFAELSVDQMVRRIREVVSC